MSRSNEQLQTTPTVTLKNTVDHDDDLSEAPLDGLELYIAQAKKYPKLTPEEVNQLAIKAKKGNKEVFNQLMKSNLLLVVSVANRYSGMGLSVEDLIQEGNLGLMIAIKNYNPSLGFRLSTYAVYWIKEAMIRAIQNTAETIRKPVNVTEKIKLINRTARELRDVLGREPTLEELSNKLQMPPLQIKKLLRLSRPTLSFAEPVGDDGKTLGNCLPGSSGIEEDVLNKVAREQLLKLFKKILNDKEYQVIIYFFGFHEIFPESLSLKKIAKIFSLTDVRIGQIKKKAMKKIKASSEIRRFFQELEPVYMDELGKIFSENEDQSQE